MKKWYSFYTSYEDFGDAVNALSGQMDISSLKLQQVAAEIQETASEEKLQQVVAEIPFPVLYLRCKIRVREQDLRECSLFRLVFIPLWM